MSGAAEVRDYVETYLTEDEVLVSARTRGEQAGCAPVTSSVGATLRFLATTLGAKAVVEVGTGTGTSGLYLYRGMSPDGVLTSIDVEPEYQRAARRAFTSQGVASGRQRLILGRALDVLPRLTDAAYDLVFVDAVHVEYPRYLDECVRLLRPGGVIAMDGVLAGGTVADPDQRGAETIALREVARSARTDDRLAPVLLPVGEGLLVAARLR
jgi:predicted O-methyltransferase YrrM